jgi:SAM-dependent methyltransferase
MQYVDVHVLRRRLGDPHISGRGIEVGAGLHPVNHLLVEKLIFLDKRNEQEFVEYFGAPPAYPLASHERVREEFPEGADFIAAHHVLEHADNPIAVLLEWLSLLKDGGTLYLSIPSEANTCEDKRLLTPIRHIMEDFFLKRPAGGYDSKQHIYSFAMQWTLAQKEYRPWYSNGDAQELARELMHEVRRRDDHDLHWHTYDMPTIIETVEIAFFLRGRGCEWLLAESSDDSHYLIARTHTGNAREPPALTEFKEDIGALNDLLTGLHFGVR